MYVPADVYEDDEDADADPDFHEYMVGPLAMVEWLGHEVITNPKEVAQYEPSARWLMEITHVGVPS